jgi:hypothetical protein
MRSYYFPKPNSQTSFSRKTERVFGIVSNISVHKNIKSLEVTCNNLKAFVSTSLPFMTN